MGVKQYDRPSKEANKITKDVFKGKEGKAFRRQLVDYLRNAVPLTEAYTAAREQFLPQLSGLLQQGINYQQSALPLAQQAVHEGLQGRFFDIAPWQQYAERQLQRTSIPNIAQTFATLNTPNSSDTTGQIINAGRDAYTELGALGAGMNFQAKNALINQGGLGGYFNAAQQPANLGFGGVNQLLGSDMALRQAEQSGMPGAGSLFPSFLGTGLEPLSQQSSRGRLSNEI